MHRAAFAAARAGSLAIDFRHHLLHIDAFGDAMAVAAMSRGDAIIVLEMHHDPRRGSFFAGIEMDETGNIAAREFEMQALFEFSDRTHDPISFEQFVLAQWKRILSHPHPP